MNSEQSLFREGESKNIDCDKEEPEREWTLQVCKHFEELIYEISLKKCQYFCCGACCQGSDSLPQCWSFWTKELGHETENLNIFPMKLTLKDEHSGYTVKHWKVRKLQI